MLADAPKVAKRLRALWALHCTGGINQKHALSLLDDSEEYIRAWTVQLLSEEKNLLQLSGRNSHKWQIGKITRRSTVSGLCFTASPAQPALGYS